jgi:4-hydroxy-4-methyl-2-oxoglutarate aldolase
MARGGAETMKQMKFSGVIPQDRIHCYDFPRPSQRTIKRYLRVEDLTSGVSDLLDERGINGAIPGFILQPVTPGKRIVGPAITLRHLPARKTVTQKLIDKDKPGLAGLSDAVEIAREGDVIVCDGGGRTDISGMGYLAALRMKKKGLAGTILDCGFRDIEGIRKIGYPTWARGVTPRSGLYRFEAYEINVPIACAGVQVHPGDLVVADESGLAIVPSSLIEEVLVELEHSYEKEKQQEGAILKGKGRLE